MKKSLLKKLMKYVHVKTGTTTSKRYYQST